MAVLHSTAGSPLALLSSLSIGSVALILGALGLAVLIIDYARILYLHTKLPPGPVPLPLIGNTYLLPRHKPWLYFEQLSKDYNCPLVTVWLGRTPTIWINEAQAAYELFEKKAALYGSRPEMLVFGKLSGRKDTHLVTMQYGDRLRVHRKLMHNMVGVQKVRGYWDFQNAESKVMALDVLRSPQDYVAHIERYATSVVSIIGYGRRVASSADPIITEVIAVMHRAADLNVPGWSMPMLMESFPILAKFPAAIAPWMRPFKRGGRGMQFFYALADEANKTSQQDPCHVKMLFREQPTYQLNNEEVASLSANLFGAGSDTSSSTLITFILACCAFPEVLPAAWAELDAVCGAHRSPELDDKPNLPYVSALVKEVFRWRSVAVIGGQPHAPTDDDEWRGYKIPKGAWIQGNTWAIHHNAADFPDPDRFNPNRFLEGHADHRPFPTPKGYMAFGWGRRVCSGQALAEQGTWISVARMLWAFDIRKGLDSQGKEIPVDIHAYTNGLNMRPQEFQARFIPRSAEIRETMEREARLALQDLEQYDGESKYRMSEFYAKPDLGGLEKSIK